jgi:hypothetical protein
MFSVKFQNGQFLGMSMSKGFIFAINENFRYSFDSIAQIEKTKNYFCNSVGQSSFVIVDKQLNEIQSITL